MAFATAEPTRIETPPVPDVDPIAETLREMFAAAAVDDHEALKAIFDEGF